MPDVSQKVSSLEGGAQPSTYFVSGHLDLSQEEFNQHYRPRIDLALADHGSFIVGDARGADLLAQQYLSGKESDVTVFHMLVAPRNNAGNFPTVGGFENDRTRDEEMTRRSTADIAWVRPGREGSGTAKNLARRAAQSSEDIS